MFRSTAAALLFSCVVLFAVSCGGDEENNPVKPPDNPPGSTFENLTERWHVLGNLELAYNQRNTTEYDRLIDPVDFVFFFSTEDFNNGKTPQQWDAITDKVATGRLLMDVVSIDLDVVFDADALQWVEVHPSSFPSEIWYTTVVNYHFSMRFNQDPATMYETTGHPTAQFTVRPWDDDGTTRYRLVEWRDLTASTAPIQWVAAEGRGVSWGVVKSSH